MMMRWIQRVPLVVCIAAALTLGLAPFFPEPHLVEKINMLFSGTLTRPVDIFDLCLHAAPFILLALKFYTLLRSSSDKA